MATLVATYEGNPKYNSNGAIKNSKRIADIAAPVASIRKALLGVKIIFNILFLTFSHYYIPFFPTYINIYMSFHDMIDTKDLN
jgi:hypothetical protein